MNAERMEILRPYVTKRIQNLVGARLLDGQKFFRAGSRIREYSRREIKLVLLMVTIANPREALTADEREVLEGSMRQLCSRRLKQKSTK